MPLSAEFNAGEEISQSDSSVRFIPTVLRPSKNTTRLRPLILPTLLGIPAKAVKDGLMNKFKCKVGRPQQHNNNDDEPPGSWTEYGLRPLFLVEKLVLIKNEKALTDPTMPTNPAHQSTELWEPKPINVHTRFPIKRASTFGKSVPLSNRARCSDKGRFPIKLLV